MRLLNQEKEGKVKQLSFSLNPVQNCYNGLIGMQISTICFFSGCVV